MNNPTPQSQGPRKSSWRTITTSKPGECAVCHEPIPVGMELRWHPKTGLVHFECTGRDFGKTSKGQPLAQPAMSDPLAPVPIPAPTTPSGINWRTMQSKFAGKCKTCGQAIPQGAEIRWAKGHGAHHPSCVGGPTSPAAALEDPEYQRGLNEAHEAQQAGPAGSEAREQAYLDMEARWEREGFDG